jgi:hypothetical protein
VRKFGNVASPTGNYNQIEFNQAAPSSSSGNQIHAKPFKPLENETANFVVTRG